MNLRKKLLISALVSTSLATVAMPAAIAAGTDEAAEAPAISEPAPQQLADWEGGRFHKGPHGDDDWQGGPGMHRDGGPGMHRDGGPGMGFNRDDDDGFGPGRGDGPGAGPGGRGPAFLIATFDTDKDGNITKEEIAAGVAAKTKAFDKDGDGVLSLEEYKALWTDGMNEMIVRSFQRFDSDGDAKVTVEEYSMPVDHLVARLDQNGDGTIDKAELASRGPQKGAQFMGDGHGPGFGRGQGHGPGMGNGQGGRGPAQ